MPDLAVELLRHGYGALEIDRRRRGGGRSYASRLLGRRAVVLGGSEGARLFYDEEAVERTRAVPPPLAWLLFGKGAVHGLDDEQHRKRKHLFTSVLGPGQVESCTRTARQHLADAVGRSAGSEVEVFSLLVSAYGRAVIPWAGVDVSRPDAEHLSHEFARIVDGFGFAGSAYTRAWRARRTTNA
jgi:fatty-acid peroxygenase